MKKVVLLQLESSREIVRFSSPIQGLKDLVEMLLRNQDIDNEKNINIY